MKNFSLKALSAFIFAAGLVVAGVAAPANAATTATISTTTFAANTTVASALTISYSDTNPGASTYVSVGLQNLLLPNSCSGTTSTFSTCGISAINVNGSAAAGGTTVTKVNSGNFRVDFPASTTVTSFSIDFSANQLTVGSNGGNYNIQFQAVSGGSAVAFASYTVTPPVYTLTFNSNDGTNTTATQTGNGLITLNANPFTRSGYTFAGWVPSPSSSFVIAQNSAQFTLASTQTLYAKWTANSSGGGSGSGSGSGSSSSSSDSLANTGINTASGISLLAGGLSLALVGAEMFMIARRKRSN